MGVACLATDTRLNRRVALEVLPPAFTSSRALQARFEREADTVYGAGEANGTHFVAMRFVDGEPLAVSPVPGETTKVVVPLLPRGR